MGEGCAREAACLACGVGSAVVAEKTQIVRGRTVRCQIKTQVGIFQGRVHDTLGEPQKQVGPVSHSPRHTLFIANTALLLAHERHRYVQRLPYMLLWHVLNDHS